MKKRFFTILLCVVVILCGCAKDEKDNINNMEKFNSTVNLQMGMIDSLNPLDAQKQNVRDAMMLCFEPLFEMQNDITTKGILAEGIKITDDCTTAIIKLKDSVLWHDGTKFAAGDVIYTINYIKENEASPYFPCVKYIEEASAIDAHTVRLKLSRPYAQIVHSLYFPIISSHVNNPNEKMVGTGPYMYEEYTKASSLLLKRCTSWHGGMAKAPYVKVTVVRDNMAAAAAFNTRIIDAITCDYYDLSNYALKSDVRSTRYSSQKYVFLAFNHNSKVFDSSSMRAAVSLALDRKEIAQEAFGSNAVPANVLVHPNSSIASSLTFSEYNLNNALEMFFYEGYSVDENTGIMQNTKGEKLTFSILVNGENDSRIKCAQIIKNQLSKAGIEVTIKSQPFEKYLSSIESGSFDAYLGEVKPANIYDYEFLLSTEGELNNYGYSSRYMELALSAIAASPTEDSLENAILNFDEVFMREQPLCGIAFLSDVLITADSVNGKLLPQPNSPYANIDGWSK